MPFHDFKASPQVAYRSEIGAGFRGLPSGLQPKAYSGLTLIGLSEMVSQKLRLALSPLGVFLSKDYSDLRM